VWVRTAEVFMAHVENSAGVAEDDLITVLREPKGKGALFRCNKRTARLEKTMENEVQKGSSSNHVMRCASAHSLLTCGLLD